MPPTSYDPNSPEELPVALPSSPQLTLSPGIVLQPPLTRRGRGPGLIVFLPSAGSLHLTQGETSSLDPVPVHKWAEEGFAVVGVTSGGDWSIQDALNKALGALVARDEIDIKEKFGIIVYDPEVLSPVLNAISGEPRVVCVVSYAAPTSTLTATCHQYLTARAFFVLPNSEGYNAGSAAVSHTRSLVFLRKHIGGPHFDIEAIWDEHTYFEFEVRSVAKTMGTMVAEPYVNHVPTMTGGMGRKNLSSFYRDHFIFSNPTDTALETVSRTVGADRIIDEFIFTMTHDRVVDWLLPGVPPSGRKLSIPMMSVVNVRGDRLYHEHIWWDQAGALKQAGVLPTHLPYPLPDGKQALRLPIAGVEAARLLAGETTGKSNEMFGSDWGVSDL